MIRLLVLAVPAYLIGAVAAVVYGRWAGWQGTPLDQQQKDTLTLITWVVFFFAWFTLNYFVKQWRQPRGGGVIIIGPGGSGAGPKRKGFFEELSTTLLALIIGVGVLIWLSHLTGFR